jgi:hypothetical protein
MQIQNVQSCPLCHQAGSFYDDDFYLCQTCAGIFRARYSYPRPAAEKNRYETHNNDVTDTRYQRFVSPITRAVLRGFSPHHQGLDFGAGTGPVISHLLQRQGYRIRQYDPFFHNDPELLKKTYHYIVCCEVMEHFHKPANEFKLLKSLLKENGSLICMTHLYQSGIDFANWYYKNDPTHVFIYQRKTLQWIKERFGFSSMQVDNRYIRFNV